jgi:hypothetical protein
MPRKLKLLPQDMAKHKIKFLNFTPAKFDDSEKLNEAFIITSTGNISVIWSFASILRGCLTDYVIKPFSDEIKDI